jgi:hypothetical protein
MPTLREARRANLIAAGLPPESATDAWLDWAKVGPVWMPLPNPPARRRVLHVHDAAHVLSGYGTDFLGELEESAFELAAGCGGSSIAWLYNAQGLLGGVVVAPARTAAAWRRGAASRSVYEADLDRLLDLPVDEARTVLGVPPGDVPWRPGGRRRMALTVLLGLAVAVVQVAAMLAVPAALASWALRRRR